MNCFGQVEGAKAGEKEMQSQLEMARKDIEASRADLREVTKKREEAEAAKSAVEAMLRNQRGERRHQAYNGHYGGPPMGSPSSGGDRQGYMVSPASGNSQNSSPLHPGFSFPTFPSPSPQDRYASESLGDVLAIKLPSEEKQRKARFSSKLGSYFVKRKDSGLK
jgi:ParB-like chromosome segregation protein Spo0J